MCSGVTQLTARVLEIGEHLDMARRARANRTSLSGTPSGHLPEVLLASGVLISLIAWMTGT